MERAPDHCREIDRAAIEVGESWVIGAIAQHDENDLVNVLTAAELVGRSAKTVYQWIYSGILPSYRERGDSGPIVVLVRDLRAVAGMQRQRRRRESGRVTDG